MTTAEPVAAESAPRERVSGVVGVGIGLAVIVLCVAWIGLVGPREIEPRAALEESFLLDELPHGLALEEALALPTGEVVVVLSDGRELGAIDLEREVAGAEEPEPPAPEPPSEERGEGSPPIDWSALEALETGTPPARFFLVRYPPSAAQRALNRGFRGIEWKELSELEPKGGRIAVEGGRMRWGPYDADFVRERRFRPDPSFQDSLRVNLSRPGQYWIGYAFWPRGYPGSKEPVEALLAAIRPRDEES